MVEKISKVGGEGPGDSNNSQEKQSGEPKNAIKIDVSPKGVPEEPKKDLKAMFQSKMADKVGEALSKKLNDEDREHQQAMENIESPNRVQISISCRSLVDLEFASKSDPFARAMIKIEGEARWQKLGQTETIFNNLNPDFVKNFEVNYFFEKKQVIRIEIYDYNEDESTLMGYIEIPMNKLLTAHKQIIKDELRTDDENNTGKIIVRADSVADSNHEAEAQIMCRLISKSKGRLNVPCFRPKPDNPMLVIERLNENEDDAMINKWIPVFESESIEGNVNPEFKQFSIKMQQLCRSKRDLPLRFSAYTKINMETKALYGSVELTVDQIMENIEQAHQLLTEKGRPAGTLLVQQWEVVDKPSFVEYLKSGWYINLAVSIDFSKSNLEHHKLNDNVLNDYQIALTEVGKILEPYAYKQKFTGFGFAGIPHFLGETECSHCFSLSSGGDGTLNGLDDLMQAYKVAAANTQMWGPTKFSTQLRMYLNYMKANKDNPMYHIFLILTDGDINDIRETTDIIVECSKLPLSIIIVGIGDGDFTAMDNLDSDDRLLKNGKNQDADRDIVQFVAFNEFKDDDNNVNGDYLAEAVLNEVPDQLVGYMMDNEIKAGDKGGNVDDDD